MTKLTSLRRLVGGLLLVVGIAGGVSGCVLVPAPGYVAEPVVVAPRPVVVGPPVVFYGRGYWRYR